MYNHLEVEKKWQDYWVSNKTFKAEIDENKPKYYALDMFPYPSGAGLHVGHPEGYTATDIISRYKRMIGFNVLHCIGWDAFGLPAEQAAIRTGKHPHDTTVTNIANFKRQILSLGFSYDWDREINTTDPDYYKWTQWIFLKIFNRGLAYQKESPVNWCPELKAVLANEEVVDGKSEIGGHPVFRKNLRQWLLKITAYADRLLEDLEKLDWPESIKEMQRNWIGKSHGAIIKFQISDKDEHIAVFTTRPDTVYGATFCVLAPEHPLVDKLITNDKLEEANKYITQCGLKSELDRMAEQKIKTGVFTGSYVINPLSGQKIPIWVADYVLVSYGTGAIMCVPAHDQRDHDFARAFSLPIVPVINIEDHNYEDEALTSDGEIINSPLINGMKVSEAKETIIQYLEKNKLGKRQITYKLRDWLFSRQRYWGEPIPILLDEELNPTPLTDSDLPLKLPDTDNYQPSEDGSSPLANLVDWVNIQQDGNTLSRETNTMPQWAGSCWYYLRFTDARNQDEAWSEKAEKYWMPVDLYVGGAEHAVLHLLYSRFWHKVLFDEGYVSSDEPFSKLVNQGIILGPDGVKMSKSRGNVVNPDEVVNKHGADSLRLYEMFMGPLEKSKPWQTNGIDGCRRFLSRTWNMILDENCQLNSSIIDQEATNEELKLITFLIKRVTEDIENMKFNTAISEMMTFINQYIPLKVKSKSIIEQFVLVLSPFAPHMAEECWEKLGYSSSLAYQSWPKFDPAYLSKDEVLIPIQINGKLRLQLSMPTGASEEEIYNEALSTPKLQKHLEGHTIVRKIFVPDKIFNLVIKPK